MTAKTLDDRQRDVNALVKYVLTEMEELAGLPPSVAGSPYAFQERRARVVRKIWQTYRDVFNDDTG